MSNVDPNSHIPCSSPLRRESLNILEQNIISPAVPNATSNMPTEAHTEQNEPILIGSDDEDDDDEIQIIGERTIAHTAGRNMTSLSSNSNVTRNRILPSYSRSSHSLLRTLDDFSTNNNNINHGPVNMTGTPTAYFNNTHINTNLNENDNIRQLVSLSDSTNESTSNIPNSSRPTPDINAYVNLVSDDEAHNDTGGDNDVEEIPQSQTLNIRLPTGPVRVTPSVLGMASPPIASTPPPLPSRAPLNRNNRDLPGFSGEELGRFQVTNDNNRNRHNIRSGTGSGPGNAFMSFMRFATISGGGGGADARERVDTSTAAMDNLARRRQQEMHRRHREIQRRMQERGYVTVNPISSELNNTAGDLTFTRESTNPSNADEGSYGNHNNGNEDDDLVEEIAPGPRVVDLTAAATRSNRISSNVANHDQYDEMLSDIYGGSSGVSMTRSNRNEPLFVGSDTSFQSDNDSNRVPLRYLFNDDDGDDESDEDYQLIDEGEPMVISDNDDELISDVTRPQVDGNEDDVVITHVNEQPATRRMTRSSSLRSNGRVTRGSNALQRMLQMVNDSRRRLQQRYSDRQGPINPAVMQGLFSPFGGSMMMVNDDHIPEHIMNQIQRDQESANNALYERKKAQMRKLRLHNEKKHKIPTNLQRTYTDSFAKTSIGCELCGIPLFQEKFDFENTKDVPSIDLFRANFRCPWNSNPISEFERGLIGKTYILKCGHMYCGKCVYRINTYLGKTAGEKRSLASEDSKKVKQYTDSHQAIPPEVAWTLHRNRTPASCAGLECHAKFQNAKKNTMFVQMFT